jgi:hypothetical protein
MVLFIFSKERLSMYYCTQGYPSEMKTISEDGLKSLGMYDEMKKAKKNKNFRFTCGWGATGFLWSCYVYFDVCDAIDELIEKKYEWIGKKECEKQELVNEITELKSRKAEIEKRK